MIDMNFMNFPYMLMGIEWERMDNTIRINFLWSEDNFTCVLPPVLRQLYLRTGILDDGILP